MGKPVILYISSRLPSRSETFVYHEFLALQAEGIAVMGASIHAPQSDLGDERLERMAQDVVPVYGTGAVRLLLDAACEFVCHPVRGLATMWQSKFDALFATGYSLVRRGKIVWQACAALALARRVRSSGVTHIHAHMAHVPTTIAMYCAKQLGTGFSFTGHAADLFPQRTLLEAKLQRADFVACISHWHRRFYQQLVPGLSDQQLPIVRCGVTLATGESQTEEQPPVVMAVGRLIPKKGFQTLVKAMGILRQKYTEPVQCHIIGDGPEGEILSALIDELGLKDMVKLLGAKSNLEIREILPKATMFVLPCQIDPGAGDRDGIPVALMEAMASHLCVVTGRLEPIDELVRDGDTGLLVEPGNQVELAAAMQSLLRDDDRRTQLASQGRDWVQQEFSEHTNVARLLAAFKECGAV